MPKPRKQKAPLSLDYVFKGGEHELLRLWQVIEDNPEDIWRMIDDFGLQLNDEAFEALQARDPR